jgi:hypothetical protein
MCIRWWEDVKMATLWATVLEIESGLFRAVYSNAGTEMDTDKLPQYHRASSAGEAKQEFEHSAQIAGFGIVTWVDVNATDLTVAARTGLNV